MKLVQYVDFAFIEEAQKNIYKGGLFESYKSLGPKQKGAVSEHLISDILTKLNYDVKDPISSDHDRIVDGLKAELKTATLITGKEDTVSFLQIRPSQDTDIYLMSIVFPNDVECYWVTKVKISELIFKDRVKPQHGGKKGNSGTFCWYPTVDELREHGTSVSEGLPK